MLGPMRDEVSERAIVHDLRNQLAIAIVHLESWRDGKLAPTEERIATVLGALGKVDALIGVLYAARSGDENLT